MIDWPDENGATVTPAHRAVLLRRLRRTLAELEEMGVVAPSGLTALAASAPDDEGAGDDASDPFGNVPI